ncbi:MAG: MAE_28990/MAE_18760 family HEPN-like nuclease [Paraburkholderia sp.]|uniref:MAE_28990/MAE_18760 family HEPN-like nuclease n=1 Tax=Paraburkholderia sp. TaxID=1926495 RepID=UPI003C5CA864
MTARYTAAYQALQGRLVEVEILLRSAARKERRSPINSRHEINALCRGAIVLLCAHLEAYVKELGELAIDSLHVNSVPRKKIASQFFFHISKNFIEELRETGDPEKSAEKIFLFLESDADLWSRDAPFPRPVPVDRFNRGFANPAFSKIQSYFGRFGYVVYGNQLAARMRAHYMPTRNMVDHLVDTRNKIAHGDPLATKTPSDVTTMIKIVKDFCRATDFIFSIWWRQHFCPIR